MTTADYERWLAGWFGRRMTLPADAATRDFFKEGWLDSLRTLELIVEIETEFQIPLTEAAYTDPRFTTIAGVAEILSELRAG